MKRWILLMMSMAAMVASAEESAVPATESALKIERMVEAASNSDHGFSTDYGARYKPCQDLLDEPGNHAKDLGRLLDMSFSRHVRRTAIETMIYRNEYDVGLLNKGLEGWLKKCSGSELKFGGPFQGEGGYCDALLRVMIVKGDARSVDVALGGFPIRDEAVASKVVELIGERGEQRHLASLIALAGTSEGKVKEEMLKAAAKIKSRKPGKVRYGMVSQPGM